MRCYKDGLLCTNPCLVLLLHILYHWHTPILGQNAHVIPWSARCYRYIRTVSIFKIILIGNRRLTMGPTYCLSHGGNKDGIFFKPNIISNRSKEPYDPCAFQTRRPGNCGCFCKVLWLLRCSRSIGWKRPVWLCI